MYKFSEMSRMHSWWFMSAKDDSPHGATNIMINARILFIRGLFVLIWLTLCSVCVKKTLFMNCCFNCGIWCLMMLFSFNRWPFYDTKLAIGNQSQFWLGCIVFSNIDLKTWRQHEKPNNSNVLRWSLWSISPRHLDCLVRSTMPSADISSSVLRQYPSQSTMEHNMLPVADRWSMRIADEKHKGSALL